MEVSMKKTNQTLFTIVLSISMVMLGALLASSYFLIRYEPIKQDKTKIIKEEKWELLTSQQYSFSELEEEYEEKLKELKGWEPLIFKDSEKQVYESDLNYSDPKSFIALKVDGSGCSPSVLPDIEEIYIKGKKVNLVFSKQQNSDEKTMCQAYFEKYYKIYLEVDFNEVVLNEDM